MHATVPYENRLGERCVVVADKVTHVTPMIEGSVIHLVTGEELETREPVKVMEARIDNAMEP